MSKDRTILLSDNLCKLIKDCIKNKYIFDKICFGEHTMYLTPKLKLEYFKEKVFEVNNRLYEITRQKKTFRCEDYHSEFTNKEISKWVLEFHGNVIFENYLKFDISDEELEELVSFDYFDDGLDKLQKKIEIVDFNIMIEYFALLYAFNEHIETCRKIEKGDFNFLGNYIQGQFQTIINDKQRGKLYDLLVQYGFISDNDKDGFIWAFGGVNDKYTSYSIKWIKQNNLAVYLIDKLCIDNGRLWAIGSRIFDIKNMAQIKQGYFSINKTSKPKGYELIDKIISEAQK